MVETDEGQRAARPIFARDAVFASMLVIALPASIFSDQLVTDCTGPVHREIVDASTYPWSAIGKVGNRVEVCTGVVIGPNQWLTAAHCLYNKRASRFVAAGSVHFLLGYARGEYRVHRVASRYMIPPTFDPTKVTTFHDDWAILYTNEPFPSDVKPLRLTSETPPLGKVVKTGGYAAERLHMMTADQHCRVKAISSNGKLISHDCVVHHGDSGGPLLSADGDDKGLILGINVLGHSRLEELQDQSREGGVAVSAATITEFLASQVVGSIESEGIGKGLSTRLTMDSLRSPTR